MLAWLRKTWLRRLTVALVAACFAPVVCATAGCQVECVAQSSSGHQHAAESKEDMSKPPSQHAAAHLQHAGACYLGALPVLTSEPVPWPAMLHTGHWVAGSHHFFASFIGPPTDHRPRA